MADALERRGVVEGVAVVVVEVCGARHDVVDDVEVVVDGVLDELVAVGEEVLGAGRGLAVGSGRGGFGLGVGVLVGIVGVVLGVEVELGLAVALVFGLRLGGLLEEVVLHGCRLVGAVDGRVLRLVQVELGLPRLRTRGVGYLLHGRIAQRLAHRRAQRPLALVYVLALLLLRLFREPFVVQDLPSGRPFLGLDVENSTQNRQALC